MATFSQRLDSVEHRLQSLESGDRAISRLGEGSTALGEALLQFEKNQKLLAQLDSRVALTTEKVEAGEKVTTDLVEYRRKVLGWAYLAAGLVFIVLTGVVLTAVTYLQGERRKSQEYKDSVYSACVVRNNQAELLHDFFLTKDVLTDEDRKTLDQAFPGIDCETLR